MSMSRYLLEGPRRTRIRLRVYSLIYKYLRKMSWVICPELFIINFEIWPFHSEFQFSVTASKFVFQNKWGMRYYRKRSINTKVVPTYFRWDVNTKLSKSRYFLTPARIRRIKFDLFFCFHFKHKILVIRLVQYTNDNSFI